jgi:hypothetical protein
VKPWWAEDSADPWPRYLRGELSYNEYVEAKRYGLPVGDDSAYTCPCCGQSREVDRAFLYCRSCRICLECEDILDVCDCWMPVSARTKNEHTGPSEEAIAAAIAGMPQAAQDAIRDALAEG